MLFYGVFWDFWRSFRGAKRNILSGGGRPKGGKTGRRVTLVKLRRSLAGCGGRVPRMLGNQPEDAAEHSQANPKETKDTQ